MYFLSFRVKVERVEHDHVIARVAGLKKRRVTTFELTDLWLSHSNVRNK